MKKVSLITLGLIALSPLLIGGCGLRIAENTASDGVDLVQQEAEAMPKTGWRVLRAVVNGNKVITLHHPDVGTYDLLILKDSWSYWKLREGDRVSFRLLKYYEETNVPQYRGGTELTEIDGKNKFTFVSPILAP